MNATLIFEKACGNLGVDKAHAIRRFGFADPGNITQQELIRSFSSYFGMTRQHMAIRIGTSCRTLDKWALPDASNDHRPMPDMAWQYFIEIMMRFKDEN